MSTSQGEDAFKNGDPTCSVSYLCVHFLQAVPSTMSKDDFFYALLDAKRPVELTFRVRLRNAQGE
jgi:hypothetical protein